MGVRIPPRLPDCEIASDGFLETGEGVFSGSGSRIPTSELAQPQRRGGVHHGGAGGGVRPRDVSGCGRRGPVAAGGGHPEMSETGTTAKQWFVVHTYSGFENKVASGIESRAKIFGLQDMIGRVIVPTEKVREIRKSKK